MEESLKTGKKELVVHNPHMVWAVTSLRLMGGSVSRVARLLGIHRETVKKALETDDARDLVDRLKKLVLMLGPKACEVVAKDLSYEGKDPNRLKLRSKTAMRILEAPGIFPRDSKGNVFIEAVGDKSQINVNEIPDEELCDWLMKLR